MQIFGSIFDLDGTVIDTLSIVIDSFRKAITTFLDRPYTDDEIMQLFGPSEEGVIKQVLPGQWQEGLAIYQREYEALFHQKQIGPFPGIEEALRYLKKSDIRTALVTGKSASSTAFSLREAGLGAYFELVQSGSPDGSVKPRRIQEIISLWEIEPLKAFYLGDSPSDIQDARAAGVIPLAAAWTASTDRNRLTELNPLAIFNRPQEFSQWLAVNLT